DVVTACSELVHHRRSDEPGATQDGDSHGAHHLSISYARTAAMLGRPDGLDFSSLARSATRRRESKGEEAPPEAPYLSSMPIALPKERNGMCFFSLHNECPPVNYATAEAMKVTDGLVAGERATAETLRAIADCVTAMASIVDAGGGTVAGFGELIGSSGPPDIEALAAQAAEVRQSY